MGSNEGVARSHQKAWEAMKVLLVHNRYQQQGGEDSVVEAEAQILSDHGAQVELLKADNDDIRGVLGKIKASLDVVYSPRGVARIRNSIAKYSPDVVHVHNWFPTLSPAIFWTCGRNRVPVVHTLHNYRLLCVKASLYRNGKPCEECLGKSLRLPGIIHGCYRGSRSGSAAATAAMLFHWRTGTWERSVDRFIALSHFAKNKLVQGGVPASKIAIKPNALATDPGVRNGDGGYFAYVGRLTDEKGIPTLLECWRLDSTLPKLRIVGTGPLEGEIRAAAKTRGNIDWLGPRSSAEVLEIMGRATAVVCPSAWYEGMPRVVIESMAVGTPVIASRLGTYIEMIQDGRSGMLFDAGNPTSLLSCVKRAGSGCSLSPMRDAARIQFETHYSATASFQALLKIYREASLVRKKLASVYGSRPFAA